MTNSRYECIILNFKTRHFYRMYWKYTYFSNLPFFKIRFEINFLFFFLNFATENFENTSTYSEIQSWNLADSVFKIKYQQVKPVSQIIWDSCADDTTYYAYKDLYLQLPYNYPERHPRAYFWCLFLTVSRDHEFSSGLVWRILPKLSRFLRAMRSRRYYLYKVFSYTFQIIREMFSFGR